MKTRCLEQLFHYLVYCSNKEYFANEVPKVLCFHSAPFMEGILPR